MKKSGHSIIQILLDSLVLRLVQKRSTSSLSIIQMEVSTNWSMKRKENSISRSGESWLTLLLLLTIWMGKKGNCWHCIWNSLWNVISSFKEDHASRLEEVKEIGSVSSFSLLKSNLFFKSKCIPWHISFSTHWRLWCWSWNDIYIRTHHCWNLFLDGTRSVEL